jgi:hypothetical protein
VGTTIVANKALKQSLRVPSVPKSKTACPAAAMSKKEAQSERGFLDDEVAL